MPTFVAFLLVAGGFAAILAAFVLLAFRIRRHGLGGTLMGPLDEVYNPAAHRARFDIESHEERVSPLSSAGDRSDRDSQRRVCARRQEREFGEAPAG